MMQIKAALFGVAVGDALGVPVEFQSRDQIRLHPVTDMTGFGTHLQPPGTWSDDSSLTFCLAEALTHDFSLDRVGEHFVRWYQGNYWTAHGEVFDIGIGTRRAIVKLSDGVKAHLAGGTDESDNGNGSLMRVLPLLFYAKDKPIRERYELVRDVSSITHGHIRSVVACFYYLEFARLIIEGQPKEEAYKQLQYAVPNFLISVGVHSMEIQQFDRLLKGEIYTLDDVQIESGGYVLHTLESSIWCVMNTSNYRDAVLRAVNLGRDTDTTGAVTGGLAGLIHGCDGIPPQWISQLARRDDIYDLAERMGRR